MQQKKGILSHQFSAVLKIYSPFSRGVPPRGWILYFWWVHGIPLGVQYVDKC